MFRIRLPRLYIPRVGPHAELVLGVVVQVGEHSLLLSCLPELLLAGAGSLPKLDLILCHLKHFVNAYQ